MKKKSNLILWLCLYLLICNQAWSQENLKLMFYNLLNYPLEDAVPNRLQDLGTILGDYQPDLFMVCELNNASGANDVLGSLRSNVSSDFEMATFQTNSSDDTGSDQNDLQNLIFYNSSKFILESQEIVTTIFRDFNIYKLKLNSTDQATNPIEFYAIVCHLKASNGTENQAFREQMVEDLFTYLEDFDANDKYILAGDFNFYTNSEDGFQLMTDFNRPIYFEDPANRVGSWSNNTNYLDVFTQSTRTQTGLGGATGGFDDRFDFIMTTPNLLDSNTELSYLNNSYAVYGNNNNSDCYNSEINSSDCAGSDYSFAIRNALYNFSDHLPVTIELQTDATLSTTETIAKNGIEFVNGNAVTDALQIKINPLILKNSPITVWNTLGQLVASVQLDNSGFTTLDTSFYSNGMYYIRLSGLENLTFKFVVSH